MSDHVGARVHVYEYGEANDDLQAAFYVDERAYADQDLARTVLEIADATLTRLGVIYSVEVTSGADARAPFGVPTWEEFRQRHFVEGVPLPVRPAPAHVTTPPSWQAMNDAMDQDHRRFREYLEALLGEAADGGSVSVRADRGPLRRSPGSIDRSDEQYGFEVSLRADIPALDPAAALDRMAGVLRTDGWQAHPSGTTMAAVRGGYRLWMEARPGYLLVEGESPHYRAPAEPGSSFEITPRPAVRQDVRRDDVSS